LGAIRRSINNDKETTMKYGEYLKEYKVESSDKWIELGTTGELNNKIFKLSDSAFNIIGTSENPKTFSSSLLINDDKQLNDHGEILALVADSGQKISCVKAGKLKDAQFKTVDGEILLENLTHLDIDFDNKDDEEEQ
jgi:hypothetical protein